MPYRNTSIEGRFLSGDTEAHEQVARWISQILNLPRFRILRPDWPDLLQDVLRRVIESLRSERFDGTHEFRVYVQSIARYTAREVLLRRFRSPVGGQPIPSDAGTFVDTERLILNRRAARRILSSVSPPCRRLFELFFYRELGHAEIARELGIPVGTVKSRLFRCLRDARKRLDRKPEGG